MKLKVLASSSKGNSYLLQSEGGDSLLIEVGLQHQDLLRGLDYDIKRIVGCLITHEHKDHSFSLQYILGSGIRVLAPESVFKVTNQFATIAEHKHKYKIGEFSVIALQAYHDVPCMCYVIEHPELGKLLFATDTYKLPYRIKHLNHLMIECNYTDEALAYNEEHGYCPKSLRDRLMLSHMELETTKKVIKANMSDELQDVVLLHLSNDNSDADRMTGEIASLGIPVHIARRGLEIDYNLQPY